MRKATSIILNQLNIKKNPQTILKKIRIKKIYVWKHFNNSQCFKEKNYKAKFLTNSILKKVKSIKIILGEKKRKYCCNPQQKNKKGKKRKKKKKKKKAL